MRPAIRPFKNGHSYSPKTPMYRHNCNWCGSEFTGSYDKRYCSDPCRVNAWREKKSESLGPQPVGKPQFAGFAWGSVRFFILHRDGFRCRYCGRGHNENVALHVDHFQPKSAGGSNDIDNLFTACAECNLGKGARIAQIRP